MLLLKSTLDLLLGADYLLRDDLIKYYQYKWLQQWSYRRGNALDKNTTIHNTFMQDDVAITIVSRWLDIPCPPTPGLPLLAKLRIREPKSTFLV